MYVCMHVCMHVCMTEGGSKYVCIMSVCRWVGQSLCLFVATEIHVASALQRVRAETFQGTFTVSAMLYPCWSKCGCGRWHWRRSANKAVAALARCRANHVQ